MSTLNIVEGGQGAFGSVVRSIPKAAACQNVTFSTESTSEAMGTKTHEVRVSADATCRVLVNETVASNTGMRLIANTVEHFNVAPGDIIHVVAE